MTSALIITTLMIETCHRHRHRHHHHDIHIDYQVTNVDDVQFSDMNFVFNGAPCNIPCWILYGIPTELVKSACRVTYTHCITIPTMFTLLTRLVMMYMQCTCITRIESSPKWLPPPTTHTAPCSSCQRVRRCVGLPLCSGRCRPAHPRQRRLDPIPCSCVLGPERGHEDAGREGG